MSERGRLLYVANDAGYFLAHHLPVAVGAGAAGYEVHVAAPATERASEITAHEFHFHPITMSRGNLSVWNELRAIWGLIGLYRRLKPRLVHQITIKPALYGGIAARLAGVPAMVSIITGTGYVFQSNRYRARLLRAWVAFALRLVFTHANSAVIFQNPDDRNTFVHRGIVPSEKTALILGCGVNLNRFTPQPPPDGAPVVMFASRMLWDKGVGEFVDAARLLRQCGADARFVLVGDADPGNPASVPGEQLAAWRDSGDVEWWGHRTDMPEVLAQASILCLPSTYGEGLPQILIEAAASGLAIVTTDWPGCREVVRHRDNGILVPVKDVRTLANTLGELIRDRDLRERMGARGREIAVAEFSVDKVVAENLEVYRRLLP